MGNTRILVSSGGGITDSYTYRAFGEDAGTSGTIVNPFRFGGLVGYYYDGVNREYIRSRHYKSELGRWNSQDPIGFLGGDVNLYRFVGNEPTGWSDPLGLWESGSYFGDVWSFFKGEMSALNPLNMAHGIGSAYDFMSQQGWTNRKAWGQLGSGFLNGLQFWNQPDMESAGQSFMGDFLFVYSVLKRIPPAFAPGALGNDLALAALSKSRGLQNAANWAARAAGKASRAVRSCQYERPIVIGETMPDVRFTAEMMNAEVYRGWQPSFYARTLADLLNRTERGARWNSALDPASLAHNDLWANFQRGTGRTTLDIGPDIWRDLTGQGRSSFYAVEDRAMTGSPNRIPTPRLRPIDPSDPRFLH